MAKTEKVSAGILLYRGRGRDLQLLLAHPGGPFWVHREAGAWTIPKGVADAGEDLLAAARREFAEETGSSLDGPFQSLGSVRQRAGKVVHAWAVEGDLDPATAVSNTMRSEWPRASGRWITYPEVDRCEWFAPEAARSRINPAQALFIDRLEAALAANG
jgi:predicted NUDIX family NTP pyrophosphohydrolase